MIGACTSSSAAPTAFERITCWTCSCLSEVFDISAFIGRSDLHYCHAGCNQEGLCSPRRKPDTYLCPLLLTLRTSVLTKLGGVCPSKNNLRFSATISAILSRVL